MRERTLFRWLHLALSIPILGYIYGPVAAIPRAAAFVRWIALPALVATGLYLWLKPKLKSSWRRRKALHSLAAPNP